MSLQYHTASELWEIAKNMFYFFQFIEIMEIEGTFIERKTVIDLRKAVIELALPLTEPVKM